MSTFETKLMGCLAKSELGDVAKAQFAPDDPPLTDYGLPSKLVFVAPVKGAKRMAAKVAAYRGEHGTHSDEGFPFISNLGDTLRSTVEAVVSSDVAVQG